MKKSRGLSVAGSDDTSSLFPSLFSSPIHQPGQLLPPNPNFSLGEGDCPSNSIW